MTHKDLDVWKVSVDFVVDIYKVSKLFPKSELYGLASQIQRAAVSIPSNIAEGAARKNTKEFIQFLYIALGSVAEVDTQLIIMQKLEYAPISVEIQSKLEHIRKMLVNLIRSLKEKGKE